MASTCKGVPVPPNYESRYSVMDEDFSPSLHSYILLICLMPLDVIIQLYAVKYGYVWLCMVIYGYVLLFMVMYGYQWLFLVMYGYVWLCMVMCGYVWL